MTTALLAAATMVFAAPASPDDVRLLRYPTVHGDTVVFSYAGDLWKCALNGGDATRLTTYAAAEVLPRISPDGKTIAFMGAYDGASEVYTMPIGGGEPVRVTYTPDTDTLVGWTPDGKLMVANGEDNSSFTDRLWIYGPTGGIPKETSITEIATGSMSPDGSTVAYNRNSSYGFNWRRYRGGTQGVVSFYNLTSNEYSEIPHARENNWMPIYVGTDVYYLSDKNLGTVNLYKFDTKSKKSTQLTSFNDADMRFPNTDGKTIVYERDGVLYAYDIASKKTSRVTPHIVNDGSSYRPMVRKLGAFTESISLSPNAKRVVLAARGEVFTVPAKDGDTRNLTQSTDSREKEARWSPDGQTIAYLSDASGEFEIYSEPQKGGKAEQLTKGGQYRIDSFDYSPDGKKISFTTSDRSLYLLDLATKKVTKVYQAQEGGVTYDWAPDSSYIAYVRLNPNLAGSVVLYRVRDGQTHDVTRGLFNDSNVTFDMGGKYLYIVSSRTLTPMPTGFEFGLEFGPTQRVYAIPLTKDITNPFGAKSDDEADAKGSPAGPSTSNDDEEEEFTARTSVNLADAELTVSQPGAAPAGAEKKDEPKPADKKEEKKEEPKELKIDFDGMEDRMIALPWEASGFQGIIGINNGVLVVDGGMLKKFDFGSKQSFDILAGFSALTFNKARDKFAYMAGPGFVGILPVSAGIQLGQGRVNLDGVEAMWDAKKEWRQIFYESWRYMRDHFYDPNFVGIDWEAKKKQYEAYLPYVQHRNDLNYILGLMIGELGTGHAYVGGGEVMSTRPPVPVGMLGADYAITSGAVQLKRIYRGEGYEAGSRGPLCEPGMNLKQGDYLLEIDGHKLDGSRHPNEFLVGKVGKTISVRVNSKPSMEGSREILVRPIASDAGLRYADWVETNRKKVEQLSNGRIGYMHVPNTSEEGMIGFAKGFYTQFDKEAMLVDERFNGGGMIPTYFYDKIMRKYVAFFRQRNGMDIGFPVETMDGPWAMLINEYAGSGGDMFPWLFRKHKVGPLIGKRTWGGLVGLTGSAPLIDGGFLSAPEFGIYDQETGEWIAENKGIDPDIEVDARPDLIAKGQDPQLEAGVKYLLDQLAKRKPIRKRPNYPVHNPGK
ncbi:MAG: PD40 domain-containing protein [Armatimonadetes bacterium]|nr:PD40 domain-containing protein [Armatimonadota bacterium]